MSISIQLNDNSFETLEEFHEACLRALERCGMKAEEYAVDLAPSNTGHLKQSIKHEVDEGGMVVRVGVPTGPTSYGVYVECGTGKFYPGGRKDPWAYQDAKGNWHRTSGQEPKPFVKPAVADHEQTYKNIIEDELKGN